MAELYYSLTSRKKIFHLASCRYQRRILSDSLAELDGFAQAADLGLRPCKCCLRVWQNYRSQESEIRRFCCESRLFVQLHEDTVSVVSAIDCWRIIAGGRGMALYHKNTQFRVNQAPSPIIGFHRQRISCDSILSYLKYIVSHDAYKLTIRQMQQSAYGSSKKKRRKKHFKNKTRKDNAIRVCGLIDTLCAMSGAI